MTPLFESCCNHPLPALDLLRAGRFALVMEFGDPQNPADAPVLAAYSPYHNVRDASYPALLLDAGENDPPRVWKEAGHVGSSKTMLIDQSADWLAFVMRELGMAPANR